MSQDAQIEMMIEQILDGALATVPQHIQYIDENKSSLEINDTKEFVYGMVMGMALGLGGALVAGQDAMNNNNDDDKQTSPSNNENIQLMVRDIIHKKMPQVRSRVYSC
jgi:hypothetical protein